jgi:isoleucyl-tRNA synthetase
VPLIIFYCDECNTMLEDYEALRHVLPFFEREGADAWYTRPAEELLPPGTRCAKCGAARWRKEDDILDVWFDSGSTHLAVLDPPGTPGADLPWPADMYLEGPDQYRGWFHSSLLVGVAVRNAAPYRHVLTHGWTLDEHGRPMSKSLGNVVLPTEICEKWGADLLRLWVASQDYTADVRMSENVMTQLSEAYRKIRNTFRFALGNLFDFEPERHALANETLDDLDRWVLERTAELVRKCREWYAAYDFHRVYHALHDYCVVDLSAFYFDVLKDRLYTKAAKNRSRRSAQTAIWKITSALVRLAAPILVFTSEEVWTHMPKLPGEPPSVHLAVFPEDTKLRSNLDGKAKAEWEKLHALRAKVLQDLERSRTQKSINASLEAKIRLRSNGSYLELLQKYAKDLPALFIVSQVEVLPFAAPMQSDHEEPSQVEILRADGAKCERCWNYSTHVGENTRYPGVCERCSAALAEIEGLEPACS